MQYKKIEKENIIRNKRKNINSETIVHTKLFFLCRNFVFLCRIVFYDEKYPKRLFYYSFRGS